MKDYMLQRIIRYICLLSILIILSCAYYNTFFNAKEYYKSGEKKQKNSKSDKIPSDVKTSYNNAIKKCWKLIDTYGDSSKYADDALLLIGKSHYNIEEYEHSEKVLQQFLLKYLNSNLIPDAKLWLAKNYIELDKEEKALEILNNLFENKVSNEVAAQSFYILGDLNFKNQNYEKAIEEFQKCVEITDDDEIKGDAEYKTGESLFHLEEYENAIYHFQKIEKLDVPVVQEYEAIMQKVNAMTMLEQYEEADQILRLMLRNQRFLNQFSLIETKLSNISEVQGDTEYAKELYYDILKKYPKKDGAALSAFYLGQLYEYEYGNFDSAKTYYDRVKKEYNRSEAKEDADKRSNLLKEYLSIRDQITKDKGDLYKLQRGDSLLVDSIAVETTPEDTLQIEESENINNDYYFPALSSEQSVNDDTTDGKAKTDSIEQQRKSRTQKTPKQKKKAVSRDPKEVEGSLIKNSFGIAEYFLIKYQNYDSSLSRYTNFVNNFSDSILTPKAFYSVYFLYNIVFLDSIKADSIKAIILDNYTETVYGKKLSGKNSETPGSSEDKIDLSKLDFIKAENYMLNQDYDTAISLYQQISEQDSGSIWAQKSQYAIAYTYEKFIFDTVLAIQSYKILANEYPNTDFGKVAKNKIAEPIEIVSVSKSDSLGDTATIDTLIQDLNDTEEQESDYIPIDPTSIIDTDMLDYKRPAKRFNRDFDEPKQKIPDKEPKKVDKKEKMKKEEPNRIIRDRENIIEPQVETDSTEIID